MSNLLSCSAILSICQVLAITVLNFLSLFKSWFRSDTGIQAEICLSSHCNILMSFISSAVLADKCLQGRATVPEDDRRIQGSCNIKDFLALLPWLYGFKKDLAVVQYSTFKIHLLFIVALKGSFTHTLHARL